MMVQCKAVGDGQTTDGQRMTEMSCFSVKLCRPVSREVELFSNFGRDLCNEHFFEIIPSEKKVLKLLIVY